MPKEVKLHVGIEDNLKEITVKIPDNDPRPWDGKDQLKHVGTRIPRIDGRAKATGKAKYTFDIQLPGMLYAKFLTFNRPAAVITKIDTSKAEQYPGVEAIATVRDKLPLIVRFSGQEILAIAAKTAQAASEALRLVKIEYQEQPFVVDLEEARKPNAPEVFAPGVKKKADISAGDAGLKSGQPRGRNGNVRKANVFTKGGKLEEIEATLNTSDALVEAKFSTQVQTHSALEPHGAVAKWEDNEHLTVWASTQSTFSVRGELANVFKLPQANVQVLTDFMGGGFGAKFGAGLYGVMAARLARQTKAPVYLMYNRKEEHLVGGNRPSSVQQVKMSANKNGKLTAIKLESYGTAGVGTGAGTSNPYKSLYQCDKIYTTDQDIFTNAPSCRAFRAPGHPQGAFGLEQVIDELAYKLNIDPLEFRKRNTLHHEARQVEYEMGAQKFGWDKRNPKVAADSGVIKRGVGVANSLWYYIYGTGFQASIQVNNDGSIELNNGVQDIGTGIRTTITMVAAEELGVELNQIQTKIGDTALGYGPASGGSQTTAGITPAVRNAAYLAKQRMLEVAAPLLGVAPQALSCADNKIFVTNDSSKSLSWKQVASKIPGDQFKVIGQRTRDHSVPEAEGEASAKRGRRGSMALIAGVQFAEVAVDTETGVVTVERVVAVHDCGRPMNRLTLESQINGGIIQGLSYALFEDRILDRNTGIMVNANMEQYKIAGSMDIPKIDVVVINENRGSSSTGAKGIGEPAKVPTAAAIANAIYHATGARVRDLPMTPEKVLAALESAK